MSQRRVLMFGWEYAPYYTGGLGVVTRSIIRSLVSQGMKVVFVLPRMPYELTEEQIKIINASQIKLHTRESSVFAQISSPAAISPYMSPQNYKELINTIDYPYFPGEDLGAEIYGEDLFEEVHKYAQRAVHIAQKHKHDIIHAHDWMTAAAGTEAKKHSKNPMVLHVHATEFDRTGGNPNEQIFGIEREGMQNSDKVIAVSERTKEMIVKHYGIDPTKIHVVHNAIDKYKNSSKIKNKINNSDKIVLFLGRLTRQKGAEYLLEAARLVSNKRKKIKFVFVGSGDMLQYLIDRSIELGIEKHVLFAGFMDHDEVDNAYRMADVFVMPSVSEPFGIAALESIKNGTPIIISKQSGVSEVVRNALKVDFWDVHELAHQILAVITYNPLAKFLAHNAEQEIRKLTWDKQSQKIVKLYNQILKK